ncbi:MAG: hypothetical protein ACREXU_20910 [Gammaproteobacteria bacterium]
MLQAGGKADLALESVGAERRGKLGMEHLERHRPVVPQVASEIDGGHAPAPELALECVAVQQPFAKRRYRVGHETRCSGTRLRYGAGRYRGRCSLIET